MNKSENQKYITKHNQEIIFRDITANDADTFSDFFIQIPYDSTNTMRYVGMQLPSVDEYKNRLDLQHNNAAILNIGAFHETKLVGYLNMRPELTGHPWVKHLAQFGMMILKEYWGLGIGKKLLNLQDDFARKSGIVRIEAKVRVSNDRGVKLYQNNGFEIEGKRIKAAFINSEFQDEYFIAKILDKN